MPFELTDAEDAKLLVLARAQRGRHVGGQPAPEAAAVRDTDGRTYSASNVTLGGLRLSAVQLAVAMAASSGVTGLEAALVVTASSSLAESDVAVVRDFAGAGVPVHRVDTAGVVQSTTKT